MALVKICFVLKTALTNLCFQTFESILLCFSLGEQASSHFQVQDKACTKTGRAFIPADQSDLRKQKPSSSLRQPDNDGA